MRQLLKRLIPSGLRPIRGHQVYNVYSISLAPEPSGNVLGGYDVRVVEHASEYQELLASGYDFSTYPENESIERGLAAGATIICIFADKELAHTSWVASSFAESIYDSIFLTGMFTKPQQGFIGPCNTYPGHRGRGLYPFAIALASSLLKDKGVQEVSINTRSNNVPSIRGILKSKFTPSAKVRVIYVLGKKMTFISENKSD